MERDHAPLPTAARIRFPYTRQPFTSIFSSFAFRTFRLFLLIHGILGSGRLNWNFGVRELVISQQTSGKRLMGKIIPSLYPSTRHRYQDVTHHSTFHVRLLFVCI
ncbi:hypothetical protein CCUS01_14702 [Colletotrichum cuscutae]|uniref:Uncharacterized protein n=1 Tax=Colletotrichum cuscutae TaxID=1209917 RepID=A0AAI9Y5J8_9PEZI|nr:hypothetical protein CCUS01_14702 [Colletotrichum cuscutae]